MREAMMDYLFNADTGAFVLNYDQDRNYQDNFTADEIFPVLFGVADATERRAILRTAARSRFRDAGRTAHDLDRGRLVFSVVRLRIAGRRLAGSDAVVRRRARAQRHDRRGGAFSRATYRGDGRRQSAQHRAGRVRRMVRRRLAEQSRNVPLALDRARSISGRWPRPSADSTAIARADARTWRRCVRRDWQWIAAARVHWGGKRRTYRHRPAQQRHLRRHARALGRRAVCVHLCRTRRERRSDDLAGRSRRHRFRRRTRRRAHFSLQRPGDEPRNVLVEFRGNTARIDMAAGRAARSASHRQAQRPAKRARPKLDVVPQQQRGHSR